MILISMCIFDMVIMPCNGPQWVVPWPWGSDLDLAPWFVPCTVTVQPSQDRNDNEWMIQRSVGRHTTDHCLVFQLEDKAMVSCMVPSVQCVIFHHVPSLPFEVSAEAVLIGMKPTMQLQRQLLAAHWARRNLQMHNLITLLERAEFRSVSVFHKSMLIHTSCQIWLWDITDFPEVCVESFESYSPFNLCHHTYISA